MNVYAIITIGGALLITGNYLIGINKAQYKIAIVVTGKVHKISADGVTLKVFYNIKNPTGSTMRMTPPLITITVDEKLSATSNMKQIDIPEAARDSSGKIVIRANAETGNIGADVLIPAGKLLALAPALIKRFKNPDPKNKIKVEVVTLSTVYTNVVSIPYSDTSNFKL